MVTTEILKDEILALKNENVRLARALAQAPLLEERKVKALEKIALELNSLGEVAKRLGKK